MKKASIDLGTNTCLLLIAECDLAKKEVIRVVRDLSTVVRLGQGVDQNRKLSEEAMVRTRGALKSYVEILKHEGVAPDSVVAVATSQARDAKNGAEFFESLKKEFGITFRTIGGDDEALYTFQGGLLPHMNPSHSVVIDIGGGSTEFMGFSGGQSLDVGSVRFHERYLKSDPVKDQEFWMCQAAIDQELLKMKEWRSKLSSETELCAVAGTATTLAAWHLDLEKFDAAEIDGQVLSRGDLHRMVEELKWRTYEERRALPSMEPMRADVILAGALILWRALEVLDFKYCRVSTRGLRYGVLFL